MKLHLAHWKLEVTRKSSHPPLKPRKGLFLCINNYVNLIIIAELSTNEGLYFRYLTMMAKAEVVVETKKALVDYYYKNLKSEGLYDYVSDMVTPECNVEGIRIDKEYDYPLTIKTDNISSSNVQSLLIQIEQLKKIKNSI